MKKRIKFKKFEAKLGRKIQIMAFKSKYCPEYRQF